MTEETCSRCGATRSAATPFCTNCGAPFAPAAGGQGQVGSSTPAPPPGAWAPPGAEVPPGQTAAGHLPPGHLPPGQVPPGGPGGPASPTGGGNQGRIALIIAVVLLVLIGGGIAAAFVLDDDDDSSGKGNGKGRGEPFCAVWADFEETSASTSLEEMQQLAGRMRKASVPDDLPADAEAGIDTILRIVEGAESVDDVDDTFDDLSTEEQGQIQAAFTYASHTCTESGDGGDEDSDSGSGSSTESDSGLGSSDGSDSQRGQVAPAPAGPSAEEFCEIWADFDEVEGSEFDVRQLRDIANRMAALGTPADMPADAKDGVTVLLNLIHEVETEDEASEHLANLSPTEQDAVQATFEYAEATCSDASGSSTGTPDGLGASPR